MATPSPRSTWHCLKGQQRSRLLRPVLPSTAGFDVRRLCCPPCDCARVLPMKGDGKALRKPEGLELGRRPGRRSNLLSNDIEYFLGGRTPRSHMRLCDHRSKREALGLTNLSRILILVVLVVLVVPVALDVLIILTSTTGSIRSTSSSTSPTSICCHS